MLGGLWWFLSISLLLLRVPSWSGKHFQSRNILCCTCIAQFYHHNRLVDTYLHPIRIHCLSVRILCRTCSDYSFYQTWRLLDTKVSMRRLCVQTLRCTCRAQYPYSSWRFLDTLSVCIRHHPCLYVQTLFCTYRIRYSCQTPHSKDISSICRVLLSLKDGNSCCTQDMWCSRIVYSF